jgi:hypothetical protein
METPQLSPLQSPLPPAAVLLMREVVLPGYPSVLELEPELEPEPVLEPEPEPALVLEPEQGW